MLRTAVKAVIVVLLPVPAFAQGGAPEDSPWSGKASLGYLATSGNTNTTSYNTAFEIAHTATRWTHQFDAKANGADESETTTAEAYQVGWKSMYEFSEHNYLFGSLNWRKDPFSGVNEQFSQALGYGRRLIDKPAHLLSAEVGVGHRDADRRDGTSESSVIGTLGMDYRWTFSETSNFEQGIVVESGSENTYIESVSAVRAKLVGDLAIVLSYTIKHNTDVPLGSENTDKFTAISLEYAF